MITLRDIVKERDRLTKRISRMTIRANNETVDECDALEDLANWSGWRGALTWILPFVRELTKEREECACRICENEGCPRSTTYPRT